MANRVYHIAISHKDKGVGFTSKHAIQNYQGQGTLPIKKVRIIDSSSKRSKLEVTIDIEEPDIKEIISNALLKSGRMPTKENLWKIESVKQYDKAKELIKEHASLKTRINELEEEAANLATALEDSEKKISNPLEGLLAYFETTDHSVDTIFEEAADSRFAKRIFSGEVDNDFRSYLKFSLKKEFTEDEIDDILKYESKGKEEIEELRSIYETAKKELEFLKKIEEGETDIPESLRDDYASMIRSKNHEKTIREYEAVVKDEEEKEKNHRMLVQKKKRFDSITDMIELYEEATEELPVIISSYDEGVELYFPIKRREVKEGFISDLGDELKEYYDTDKISTIDSKFVAYNIKTLMAPEYSRELVNNVPLTLKVTGYTELTPLILG